MAVDAARQGREERVRTATALTYQVIVSGTRWRGLNGWSHCCGVNSIQQVIERTRLIEVVGGSQSKSSGEGFELILAG